MLELCKQIIRIRLFTLYYGAHISTFMYATKKQADTHTIQPDMISSGTKISGPAYCVQSRSTNRHVSNQTPGIDWPDMEIVCEESSYNCMWISNAGYFICLSFCK